ncbi:MAG: hypothetical protein D3922_04740, partial [Candidatus Electrothrix sp. AR1]|nr:hypothetical protein [Candidatus Electrothrix sp. AR1]
MTKAAVAGLPVITGLDDNTYTYNSPPIIIDGDISITGGNDYGDGYIKYELTNGTPNDQLALTSSATPYAVGAISVIGIDVYRGDGTNLDRIGSIDTKQNGSNGQPLLIHFASPLLNGSFEDGLTGWNQYSETFHTTSTDYNLNLDGQPIPYYYSGGAETGTGSIILQGEKGTPTYTINQDTSQFTEGVASLRLVSRGNIVGPYGSDQPTGNGSLHGPYVASSAPFHAFAGDTISLDWRAVGGSDSYEVFGYLVSSTGVYTQLFSQRGDSTPWITQNTVIATEGDYTFLFVTGTYDRTGGLLVGASLYVDNLRLLSALTATASDLDAIGQQVSYSNTSATPLTHTRDLVVTIEAADGQTATANANIFFLAPPPTVTTDAANGLDANGATLNGTVNANGVSSTVTFEYGLTTGYGTTVTADQSPVTGSTDTAVSHAITGLAPSTTYHYRVIGVNSIGTSNGADMTFTTDINTYTLTYTAGANGTISGDSPQTVNHGSDGSEVTAVAAANYHFVNWSDGSTDNPRTDSNVTADISVTANFAIDSYTLTYTAGANGSISGDSPQTVNHGSDGSEVTAVAVANYHFVNW